VVFKKYFKWIIILHVLYQIKILEESTLHVYQKFSFPFVKGGFSKFSQKCFISGTEFGAYNGDRNFLKILLKSESFTIPKLIPYFSVAQIATQEIATEVDQFHLFLVSLLPRSAATRRKSQEAFLCFFNFAKRSLWIGLMKKRD